MTEDSEILGADKVVSMLRREGGSALDRTAVCNILMEIKAGRSAADIVGDHGKGRGGAGGSNQHPANPNFVEFVQREIGGHPVTTVNSQRLLAGKLG